MSRIVLRGGTVLDGSGGPGYAADVLVADGRIAEVGPSVDTAGARVIDAGGAFVAPASSTCTPISTRRCSGIPDATRCPSTA